LADDVDISFISQAILCFLDKPKYASLTSHQFTADEYQVLHDILMVLDKSLCMQELLSAEKTPTLSVALPTFEMLVNAWTNLQAEYVQKGQQSFIYSLAMSLSSTIVVMKVYLTPLSSLKSMLQNGLDQ
jgi:hypothetical protein